MVIISVIYLNVLMIVMSFKEVVKIGLKLVGGIIAGAAVFFGIGKLFKNGEETAEEDVNKEEDSVDENSTEERRVPANNHHPRENKLVEGFKTFQNVFGKVFVMVQSLTVLVENTSRVFSKDNTSYQQANTYQYNPGWTYTQPVNVGPNGEYWGRRISPFITEVGPCNPGNYYGNKYPV